MSVEKNTDLSNYKCKTKTNPQGKKMLIDHTLPHTLSLYLSLKKFLP